MRSLVVVVVAVQRASVGTVGEIEAGPELGLCAAESEACTALGEGKEGLMALFDAPAADAEDRAPSVRARLLPELAGSVHRMKESLFVLYLQDGRADASGEIRDPDAGLRLSCPLLDSRHTFLEMCQFWHYQFDSLRRAKHSTVMLLYHLHVPRAESLGISCAACAREIRRVRWHCATCVDFNICRACERERGAARACARAHGRTGVRAR